MYLRTLAEHKLRLVSFPGKNDLAAVMLIQIVEYPSHLLARAILGLYINHPAFFFAAIETPGAEPIRIQLCLCLGIEQIAFLIRPWTRKNGKEATDKPNRNRNDEHCIDNAVLADSGGTQNDYFLVAVQAAESHHDSHVQGNGHQHFQRDQGLKQHQPEQGSKAK